MLTIKLLVIRIIFVIIYTNRILNMIKASYEDATCAVIQNNHLGDRGVYFPRPCSTSSRENIMQEALTNYDSSISLTGRPICNLRFTDDIELVVGSTEEHKHLSTQVERSSSSTYGMEFSNPKRKWMVNITT